MRVEPPRSIADLLDVHPHIERAVVCARLAGVAADLPLQDRWIAHLDLILRQHMAHEERWLFPVWESVEDPPPNGTAAVLLQEHDALRDLLHRAASTTEVLPRARLLSRLEGILEHHDLREAAAFKIRLDALLSSEERAQILSLIADDLAQLPSAPPLPELQHEPLDMPRPTSPYEALLQDLLTGVEDAPRRLTHACALRAREAHALAQTPAERRAADKLARIFAQVRRYLEEASQGTPRARWLARLSAFDRLEQTAGLQVMLRLSDAPTPARTRR